MNINIRNRRGEEYEMSLNRGIFYIDINQSLTRDASSRDKAIFIDGLINCVRNIYPSTIIRYLENQFDQFNIHNSENNFLSILIGISEIFIISSKTNPSQTGDLVKLGANILTPAINSKLIKIRYTDLRNIISFIETLKSGNVHHNNGGSVSTERHLDYYIKHNDLVNYINRIPTSGAGKVPRKEKNFEEELRDLASISLKGIMASIDIFKESRIEKISKELEESDEELVFFHKKKKTISIKIEPIKELVNININHKKKKDGKK